MRKWIEMWLVVVLVSAGLAGLAPAQTPVKIGVLTPLSPRGMQAPGSSSYAGRRWAQRTSTPAAVSSGGARSS